MDRILTKEEIAELLSAVQEGEIETEPAPEAAARKRSIASLDLAKAHGMGRQRIANIDVVLDAFARNSGLSLTSELRRSVVVERTSITPMKMNPFLTGLPEYCIIGIIGMTPLKSGGLLVFDAPLAYFFIETMLGGPEGLPPLILPRTMTTIERKLITDPLKTICGDLQKAFSPVIKLAVSIIRTEIDIRKGGIVPPETEVMVAEHAVMVGDFTGTMYLAIPYPALEPLRDKLKDGVVEEMPSAQLLSWADFLADEIINVEVEVIAQSGQVPISINKLLDLKVGDVIELNYDPNTPLKILVEERPKFFALPGIQNGKKAVRITSRIGKGD